MFNQSSIQLPGSSKSGLTHFYPSLSETLSLQSPTDATCDYQGASAQEHMCYCNGTQSSSYKLGSVSLQLPMIPSEHFENQQFAVTMDNGDGAAPFSREEDEIMIDDEYVRCNCHSYAPFAHEHPSNDAFECNGQFAPCAYSNCHHEDPGILQKFSDIRIQSPSYEEGTASFHQQMMQSDFAESQSQHIENFFLNNDQYFNLNSDEIQLNCGSNNSSHSSPNHCFEDTLSYRGATSSHANQEYFLTDSQVSAAVIIEDSLHMISNEMPPNQQQQEKIEKEASRTNSDKKLHFDYQTLQQQVTLPSRHVAPRKHRKTFEKSRQLVQKKKINFSGSQKCIQIDESSDEENLVNCDMFSNQIPSREDSRNFSGSNTSLADDLSHTSQQQNTLLSSAALNSNSTEHTHQLSEEVESVLEDATRDRELIDREALALFSTIKELRDIDNAHMNSQQASLLGWLQRSLGQQVLQDDCMHY